jgi:hypothetical protein
MELRQALSSRELRNNQAIPRWEIAIVSVLARSSYVTSSGRAGSSRSSGPQHFSAERGLTIIARLENYKQRSMRFQIDAGIIGR